jgi:hypothetical protein
VRSDTRGLSIGKMQKNIKKYEKNEKQNDVRSDTRGLSIGEKCKKIRKI